ncbi:MAG TPA: sigma-70 family RNA polymerase sigma factor [Terriglobales bacterium]
MEPRTKAENHGAQAEVEGLIDNLFRRSAGQIVSYLTRLLGPEHLELAEEAVQEALIRALQAWPYSGIPDNPGGWLFHVARNVALDAVRRDTLFTSKHPELIAELDRQPDVPQHDPKVEEHLRDDELRMLFMCCHPALSANLSVPLSLKIIGGFSVAEITRALLSNETTIAQRIVRAKRQIREQNITLELPRDRELAPRLDAVLEVIYLIFNEGYAAYSGENLVRQELCFEAMRLGKLVADSSLASPKVHALMSLMAFQAARLDARVDADGNMALLEDQDRRLWDRDLVGFAFRELERSAEGEELTSYHVQAALASVHAQARDDASTDWPTILSLYDQLLELAPSPVIALNRVVAVAKVLGAEEALHELEKLDHDALRSYYLFYAVKGRLLKQMNSPEAASAFRRALECPCSGPELKFLQRMLSECEHE